MALYEALYGRPCRSPVCWAETEEHLALGPELVRETMDKIQIIHDRLRVEVAKRVMPIGGDDP